MQGRRRKDFAGRWRLERRIEDALTGQVFDGVGQAVFALEGADGLVYDETLRLQPPGAAPITATRRYLWRFAADGIDIAFADGRPFHVIPFDRPDPEALHDCPPDLYRGAYDFAAWPVWSVTWKVQGPRKRYVSRTLCRRPG